MRALREAPDELVCWTFLDAPSPRAMWARRQAHETAVHRVDAELAGHGSPAGPAHGPVDPTLAADGVEELLFAFFARSRSRAQADGAAGVVGLAATDRPSSWQVRISERGALAERGDGPSDVVVRATAQDLYLLLWHRRDLAGLDVEGDARVLRCWLDPRHVTWQ